MKLSLFSTLRGYRKEYLLKDIFSGIIIAAVSIPISMGYAQISGIPAVYGLYGSVLPILLFALFSYCAPADLLVSAVFLLLYSSAIVRHGQKRTSNRITAHRRLL